VLVDTDGNRYGIPRFLSGADELALVIKARLGAITASKVNVP